MKIKLILITTALLLFAGILSGCAGGASAATSYPGLTADEEVAYLTYNQEVYAINLSNGLQKWSFPAEPDGNITFYATPTLTEDGQLLVGSYDTKLYSLNPENGLENQPPFEGAEDRYIGSALAIFGNLFAPNADNKLYALDLQFNPQWTYATEAALWAMPATDPECTCLYLGSMDHRVYSIDALNGAENWKTEELGGSIVGTPALSPEEVLYVGTFNNEMLAINAENGNIFWRVPTNDWVWGGPALKDGVLYFGDLSGTFYALDVTNGQPAWQLTADGRITETPLITEDSIYFTTEAGSLYALNIDGTVRWTKTDMGKIYTSPLLAGDLILVAPTNADELVIAVDVNGNQRWVFSLEN
ncbi:MAG: PQQ-binding-like beta-propeller repeat protein [Anaerolineales bacterium]|jgi:outer membrane protein assembly factor BamB